jgi:hypothetical protein
MYLGNIPATSFEAVKKDRFTGLTGTGVTLSHSVSNVQDIVVWVNSVKQDYNNYTVSGTSLTLGGSLVSADVVQVLYVGRTLQTVNPAADSVTASQIADNAISEEHLDPTIITGLTALGATPADTDELLISDAGTLKRVDYSYLKSANTPAFRAYLSSNQTINDATDTVVSLDSEDYDTDSAFDTSNYRFTVPSGEAGKYFFYAQAFFKELTSPAQLRLRIRKNTSTIIAENYIYSGGTGTAIFTEANDNLHFTVITSTTADLSVSDRIDISVVQDPTNTDSGTVEGNTKGTFLHGYKLIGV